MIGTLINKLTIQLIVEANICGLCLDCWEGLSGMISASDMINGASFFFNAHI